jgi:hypothetical protein
MATTCLTAGPPPTSTFDLRWDPATDNRTPSSGIVYDVYAATSPDGHDFGRPTYSSSPGATAFTTPGLSTADSWYFVVRARDAAGNRDGNYVALEGRNICR